MHGSALPANAARLLLPDGATTKPSSIPPSLLENEPDMNECDEGEREGMDHMQIALALAQKRKSEAEPGACTLEDA